MNTRLLKKVRRRYAIRYDKSPDWTYRCKGVIVIDNKQAEVFQFSDVEDAMYHMATTMGFIGWYSLRSRISRRNKRNRYNNERKYRGVLHPNEIPLSQSRNAVTDTNTPGNRWFFITYLECPHGTAWISTNNKVIDIHPLQWQIDNAKSVVKYDRTLVSWVELTQGEYLQYSETINKLL